MPIDLAIVDTEPFVRRSVTLKFISEEILQFPTYIAVGLVDEKLVAFVTEAHVINPDCAL